MRGEGPFKWRWIPLLDPTWGVLGSRFGGGYLTMLRLAMLLEFVVGLIVQDWGRPQPALIAAAGFAITVMLSIAQLKEHYPPKTGRGGRLSPL